MFYLSIAVAVILFGIWWFQFLPAISFVKAFRQPPASLLTDEHLPKFAILMPLRGADPFLSKAIESVLDQQYPNFELRIIIDHENDPAFAVVNRVLAGRPAAHVCVTTLKNPSESCSLFCSALMQFLDEIDDSVELFVICDADTITPPNWLREMATALADPSVGTTLGNRWYVPRGGRFGSMLRYYITVMAVVQMWRNEILWTSTTGLRVADIGRAKLRDKWSRAMVEDAVVKVPLAELGLKFKFVPELMILNQEEIDLLGCYRFIRRQTFWSRLYLRSWSFGEIFNSLLCGGTMIAAVLLIPLGLLFGAPLSSAIAAIGLAGHVLGMLAMTAMVERPIRALLRARGESLGRFSLLAIIKLIVAIPLTYVFYMTAVLATAFTRRVEWRGIHYEVNGPFDVRMLGYSPFRPDAKLAEQDVSL